MRFTSAPILTPPTELRAELSQQSPEDNCLHPCACAFFSRQLSDAETDYDIRDGELLAVKLALEEWCHWFEVEEQNH